MRGPRSRLRVPPPESDAWPQEYRGANWRPAYAFLFAGKCQLCAHSCPLPRSRQLRDKWTGTTRLLQCTNHPACPGEIEEVLPTDTCRNFKTKWWRRPRRKSQRHAGRPPAAASPGKSKRIPLGHGRFAIVDAADYAKISGYKWYATRRGRNIYAVCRSRGRDIYMHRMIMKPPRGHIVHHRDRNGLNNRRDNLLVCTPRQHQACRGPDGGASRFVGVYRRGDKWEARIRCRGKVYYLGCFDDETEAAKARDRKAYELHGEFAYFNFPEDYGL
ncbi:MAG TPA: HNH endonuclease [Sedimentisphaerales bacterium]|nr:HNH endonuclease [Sedimentisphaerales bacterium]